MSFTETVHLKLYWNTTYTTEPDGTITVQRDTLDGYLIIDRMLDFSELVDKVCGVMEVDREGMCIDFLLVWTERSGKRSRVHINDDNTVRFLYLCADKWLELYPKNVERIGHGYASTSGQDIGVGTSGGRTVEDNEDGDEDEDEDEDGRVSKAVMMIPYVFDDVSGWEKTLEEGDSDGIKMWDGNPMTVDLDVHFTNKLEAHTAVGEWNLRHGRPFRVKTSSKRTWYVECETYRPKYPKERLHGYDCMWKAQVLLEKATDTWKMVVWSDSHNCLGANKRNESRNVTSSMIARLVAQNVGKHPALILASFQKSNNLFQANIDMIQICQNVLPPKPMKLYEEAPEKSMRQQGQKRVNRKKGLMDYTSKSGQRRLQTCSLCKLQGHNARACPYATVCARCGSLDHDAVECPFSHPPADRTAIDKLYDPYGIRAMEIGSSSSSQSTSKKLRQGPRDNSLSFFQNAPRFQIEEYKLTSVSITEIKTHIENNPLTDQSPHEAHLQRAFCFVGWLVGGLLFFNTTRNSFPLDLVHFLHTPEICSEYSWGSAALCYLYRSMSKSSLAASAKAITGCVILLQLWAWERILMVQPKILGEELDLSHCPLRTRWFLLAESDFVWMPYTTFLGRIARVCLEGQGIWRSQTWLLCGDVVAPHNLSRVFRQFGYHQWILSDALLLTKEEITSLLKRKLFGGSDRRWIQQLGKYLQVWNVRHGRLVGTDDDYVGEPTTDSEHLLCYHQVTVKYVTDPTDSENTRGFHGSAKTLRLMATLMEDVRSLSIIGQHTFDKDSFGYDRLGEIAQVAERRYPTGVYRPIMSPQHQQSQFAFTQFSSSQTSQLQFGDSFIDFSGFQQSSLDGQSIHYTSNFLSSMFEGVAGQDQADDPAGGERESQGKDEDEDEDEVEDADQQDQFEGQGYQCHKEQGSSQTLGTPPLAVSKGQRVTKEPDRLTYSYFHAKKSKKK
ncbi:OLC1v1007841C1 [Oldenlandia corymbosa var. corymbosa]|uniref:OLC1v1007841C1 n=1 Tax=Oldenlandia corymbosa var. corymbosa TaxID=529605 RepID=A0AAV1DND5_OLDCO|nr:OLC1v1007841C1 [Oldenlandia corymbosa var. corymbosa]